MCCTHFCRSPAAITTMLVGLLLASAAHADPTDSELQAARKLFAQAEREEDAGHWLDALNKLREVSSVKLTAGVRFHMALCEERLGQLTDALGDYTLAERQSGVEDARDVLHMVGKRLEELRARIPRLVLRVVPARPNSVVKVDGRVFSQPEAEVGVPLDPGPHLIDVSSPDATASSTSVTLHEHEVTVVDLRLATRLDAAAPNRPTSTRIVSPTVSVPVPRHWSSGRHGAAVVTTIAAATLSAGGLAAFLLAGSAHDRALMACAGVVSRMPDACDPQKRDVRLWDFIAAGAWVGALAAGTMAVTFWATPSERAKPGVEARLGLDAGLVELKGAF